MINARPHSQNDSLPSEKASAIGATRNLSPQVAAKMIFVTLTSDALAPTGLISLPLSLQPLRFSFQPSLILPLMLDRQAGAIAHVLDKHNNFKINA